MAYKNKEFTPNQCGSHNKSDQTSKCLEHTHTKICKMILELYNSITRSDLESSCMQEIKGSH